MIKQMNGTSKGSVSAPEGELTLEFDNTAWNYDKENDVYWQIQVYYCTNPVAYDYQTLGIYVPGVYFNATNNGDGTYTCEVNKEGTVENYTAETAPIVFPVNTAGYSAQIAPTSYSYQGLSDYLENGFIYVYAGLRGRDNGENADGSTYSGGAPLGITDLKAAVRFYRYNESVLPGNVEAVFTFGHSGGGAQSSIMGATGDNELYYPYLETIGAALTDKNGNIISDTIMGAMCWCPITALDGADAAYEWNMGQYFSDDTRTDGEWTAALSDDLAEGYAEFINGLNLRDSEGNVLVLEESEEGIYASGTYYKYLLQEVEESLNNFLADNTFPYKVTNDFSADGGFGGAGGSDGGGFSFIMNLSSKAGNATAKSYDKPQEYIDELNEDEEWIIYDAETNTVSISDIGAFARHCKKASKDVAAFDDVNRGQAENRVFGNGENNALHYNFILYSLIVENAEVYAQMKSWKASVLEAYEIDLTQTDDLGTDSQIRQNMYNPMYYVSDAYEGYGTSTVAPYWRIRSGIEQGDTALCTELNLALALEYCENVADVDFEMVWGKGHTTAERTGSSTTNFIEWVNECMEGK